MILGTYALAKISLAIGFVAPMTVSEIPDFLEQSDCPVQRVTSVAPSLLTTLSATVSTSIAANDDTFLHTDTIRLTTDSEKIIGDLRQWSLLKANWDGEGASLPSVQSIKNAVSFIKLIDENAVLPEPMLLASGNAGLYLNQNILYADIEFLSEGRISYFIKRGNDRHKGVLTFDNEKMPAVFQTLIWS